MTNQIRVGDLEVNSMIKLYKDPVRIVRVDKTADVHYKRITFEVTNGIRIEHIFDVNDTFEKLVTI